MFKKLSLLFLMLAAAFTASAQFGVTDEEFDSIQVARDSMKVELGEANVAVKKRLIKAEIDKTTYSVAEDPEAATQTLTEMLRKVPMVTVDGEDNILVNGQSSFKVYVNGKPNLMMSNNPKEIFKAYPAAAIKKIEVITNPGAKYDAEGTSGILNIVTQSETVTKGWTITPRIGVNNNGHSGGFFGTAQYGKFTVSANYGYGQNKWGKASENVSDIYYENNPLLHHLHIQGSARPDVFYNYGSLDASYEFSDHDLLSVNAGVFGHKIDYSSIALEQMTNAEENIVYGYKSNYSTAYSSMNYNAGMDYQHTFSKPEQALTLSYRVSSSPNNQKKRRENFDIVGPEYLPTLTDQNINPDQHSTEHTVQADFTTPFGEEHELSFGGKYIFRNNESDSRQYDKPVGTATEDWMLNDAASLHYKHLNSIASAYAEYVLKVSDFSLRAGLRYEHSHVNVSYPDNKRPGFSRNFDNLLPSIDLGYNLSATQMLKLTYAFRIARPGISQLSPYVDTSRPGFASYGNPRLENEDGHNIGLGYNLFGTKFSISLDGSFSFSNNGLTEYNFLDKAQRINTTHDNILQRRGGNLSAYINWNITPHTSLSINANGSYTDLKIDHDIAENEEHDALHIAMHNKGWQGFGFVNLNQDIWWGLKLSVSGGCGSPWIDLQRKGSGWYFYNASLSRQFLKEKRLQVSINASNFLKPYKTYSHTAQADGYTQTGYSKNHQLGFGVSISWRLGKLQTFVKKARRSISNDDVAAPSRGGGGQQGGGQGQ